MRARRLAAWLLPTNLRRFSAPLSIAAAGLGLFGLLLALVATTAAEAESSDRGLGSAVFRTVEVSSYGRDQDPLPLNGAGLAVIGRLAHVSAVFPWTQVDLTVRSSGSSQSTLSLTPRFEALQPPLTEGREPRTSGEILLPKSLLATLGIRVGATVDGEYIRRVSGNDGEGVTGRVSVVGTFDDSVAGVDGPGVCYGDLDYVRTLVAANLGHDTAWIDQHYAYSKAYVLVDDPVNVGAVVTALDGSGYLASSLSSLLTQVPQTQRFLQALRPLTGGLLLIFLVVIGWSTASSAVAARRTEVGVLRALGWSRAEVVSTFAGQFAVQGLVVGVAGSLLSVLLLGVVRLGFGSELLGLTLNGGVTATTVAQFLVLAAAPVVVFLVAGAVPILRIARIPPDDVLRDLHR